MAYYNHFSKNKYKQIPFSEIPIGDKFRCDFFKKRRRRRDIVCIKTGDMVFIEQRSKVEHKLLHIVNYTVSSYDIKLEE